MTSLIERWRALAGDGADDLGKALTAAYEEPQRRYHDLSHITWLLDEADRRAALIRDHALVGYAIWFHDAVYQPARPDNEELSAEWARRALSGNADLADCVAQLVLKTKHHAAGDATPDEALFLDMDLAILGAPPHVYETYARNIRAEFGHVPDELFAAGRGAFLQGQLRLPHLFRTELYERALGSAARANMQGELDRLRSSEVTH